MADFDWGWPERIDRDQIEELLTLELHPTGIQAYRWGPREFAQEAVNVIFIGPNGVGKTTLAQNLAYQGILRGYSVLFLTASQMLNDLAGQESASQLERRLRFYLAPRLLCLDEVGYLSYDSRHADLLFEVVSRRHLKKSTVLTTNRPFAQWNEVFPNAPSVVALVDRLIQRSEIVQIQAGSYRLKEAKEREAQKTAHRKKPLRRNLTSEGTP